MFAIAVLDDDLYYAEYVSNKLKNILPQEYSIVYYSSPSEVLKYYRRQKLDIIFIDIDMPIIDGFQLSELLREIHPNIIIIFITATDTPIIASLQYRPLGFVRKRDLSNGLEYICKLIKKELFLQNKHLIIENNNKIYKLPYNDIISLQSYKNNIEIQTDNKLYYFRQTLKSIMSKLDENMFIQINKGIVINVKKIKFVDFTNNQILMINDTTLYISRLRIKNVKEVLANVS